MACQFSTLLRSPAEIAGRLAQKGHALVERAGVIPSGRPPSDGVLRPALPFPLPDRAVIERVYASRPDERQELLDRADRIVDGRFDLLGFEGLDFGQPVNWHLEPVSKRESPLRHWSRIPFLEAEKVGDHKIIWELNRHHALVTLAQAWQLTGDPRLVAAFEELVPGWLDTNPPKLGINWASSLEVAFRIVSWTWALHLFGEAIRSELRLRMVTSLDLHGRHVERYLSTWYSPNTHLTGEALGLLYAGVAYPGLPHAARWRKKGWQVLTDQLERQVGRDGVYFEQSSWYQAYTVDFYLHALALARQCDLVLPLEFASKVTAAARVLRAIVRSDGSLPLFGDDDGGHLLPLGSFPPNQFADSLTHASVVLNDPALKPPAGPPASAVWLIGEAAWHRQEAGGGHHLTAGVQGFPQGGWYVLRTAEEGTGLRVVMRAGPRGSGTGAHSHADPLALEIETDGCPVISDPGTLSYIGGVRSTSRSTRAHATVTVADRDAIPQAGPFKWAKGLTSGPTTCESGPGWAVLHGSHTGWEGLYPGLVHDRIVLWLDVLGVLILDRLASLPEALSAELRFPLGPGVTLNAESRQTLRLDERGATRQTFLTSVDPEWEIQESWSSPIYGASVATKTLVHRGGWATWRNGVASCFTVDGPGSLARFEMTEKVGFRWGNPTRDLEAKVSWGSGSLRWQFDNEPAVNIPSDKRIVLRGMR